MQNPCEQTWPELTKADSVVYRIIKCALSTKTILVNAHSLVWPNEPKKLTRFWNSGLSAEPVSAADTAWFDQRTQKSLKQCPVCGTRVSIGRGGLGTNWAVGSPRARPPSNHCQAGISSIQPYYPPMDPAITGGHPSQDISGNGSKGAGWIESDVVTRNRGYSRGNQGWMRDQGKLYKLFFLICWDSEGFVENIFKWQSPQKEITVHHRSIYCLWRLAWPAE